MRLLRKCLSYYLLFNENPNEKAIFIFLNVLCLLKEQRYWGDVAALLRSHMIGLLPLEYNRTNNRNNAPIPNTIAAATMIKQKQLWTAATLLRY